MFHGDENPFHGLMDCEASEVCDGRYPTTSLHDATTQNTMT